MLMQMMQAIPFLGKVVSTAKDICGSIFHRPPPGPPRQHIAGDPELTRAVAKTAQEVSNAGLAVKLAVLESADRLGDRVDSALRSHSAHVGGALQNHAQVIQQEMRRWSAESGLAMRNLGEAVENSSTIMATGTFCTGIVMTLLNNILHNNNKSLGEIWTDLTEGNVSFSMRKTQLAKCAVLPPIVYCIWSTLCAVAELKADLRLRALRDMGVTGDDEFLVQIHLTHGTKEEEKCYSHMMVVRNGRITNQDRHRLRKYWGINNATIVGNTISFGEAFGQVPLMDGACLHYRPSGPGLGGYDEYLHTVHVSRIKAVAEKEVGRGGH